MKPMRMDDFIDSYPDIACESMIGTPVKCTDCKCTFILKPTTCVVPTKEWDSHDKCGIVADGDFFCVECEDFV